MSTTTTPAWTRFATPVSSSEHGSPSPPTSIEYFGDIQIDTSYANDVAIIGMGCRVPGGSNSPSELWEFLMKKGDASSDMPPFRWEPYINRNPRNAATLARTTSKGYFLDYLEGFDASFFSISPREAEQMDPQQRIALEVAWEALENAGIPPQSLAGSNTAVYVGVNSDDYAKLVLEDLENIGAHMGVGTAYCGIPSRISYLLDLMGPSIAIDAACASSLVAVHQARQAILADETDLAIAGGVNALIGPGLTRVLDEAGAIAADGKCRSFDDSAHGYGRGEGAGVVILKRLRKALSDGDHVLAVLKGSAVCADGKTAGIMAPNATAQEIVARKALEEAKLSASTISYIEAHATSTSLGDPTETAALARVYGWGVRRQGSESCFIGSIKSNIGHLEAGAGVMSLIKAVMVMQKQLVPPQANLETPSTKIDWANNMLTVCKEAKKLSVTETLPRAAVASYGYSGTVAHAIIEGAPELSAPCVALSNRLNRGVLLLLSGPQASRIPIAASKLADWLIGRNDEVSLTDLATTLSSRRGHHRFRSCMVVDSIEGAIAALKRLSNGCEDRHIHSGRAMTEAEKGSVWVFSGHGAQWKEMGQELYQTRPEFRKIVQELEPIFSNELGFSAIETLQSGNIDHTDVVQALTFLMHIGIAEILKNEAGQPAAIVGHSLGEAAAAVVAGAITLEEGALIVCRRARLYRDVMGQGALALISLPFDETVAKLGGRIDISVAIDASPSSCVISGLKDPVDQLCDEWKQEGIEVRKVKSDVPFHSQFLRRLEAPLRECLSGSIIPKLPSIPLYSTSLQDPRSQILRNVDYWVGNMIQPVLLRSVIDAIAKDGYRAFVEISSHPIVTHSIQETLMQANIGEFITIPTMVRNQCAQKNILSSVGKLHCFGISINQTTKVGQKWLSDVPGTTWSHHPYWRQVAKVPFASGMSHDPLSNTLLGTRSSIWGTDKILYQTQLDENNKPFPGKHPVHGSEIVPAAVLIMTFLNAAEGHSLEDMSLKVPVVVSPARNIQIVLDSHRIQIASKLASIDIKAPGDGAWLVNTTSRIAGGFETRSRTKINIQHLKNTLTTKLPDSFSIDYLASVQVPDMGFPWKVMEHFADDQRMLAHVVANPDNAPGCNDNWTSLLDSATSIASTIFHQEPLLRMPTAVNRIIKDHGASSPQVAYIFCKRVPSTYAVDIAICDEEGVVLVELQGMTFAGIEGEASFRANINGLVHRLAWVPATFSEEPLNAKHVAILSSAPNARVSAYEEQLSAKGVATSMLKDPTSVSALTLDSVVIFVPGQEARAENMLRAAHKSCIWLTTAVKTLAETSSKAKIFAVCDSRNDMLALRNGPLHGLARVLQSEQPENFGGIVEVEDDQLPFTTIKYIRDEAVIKIRDGVPKISRLRPFPHSEALESSKAAQSMFKPEGTYLITGGLGALGLEVAAWMVGQGAKRLLLVSRGKLPRRSIWSQFHNDERIQRIRSLEQLGAAVYALSIDMTTSDAGEQLGQAIEQLSLPAVRGVVHAAGVLVNQLVKEITADGFEAVLAPKITGAMHLNKLFPVNTLDFFVMFSSCGQLLGFPGQSSYASGNAFLDALAAQRRNQGDNAVSIMWTSWRGLGMAASTEYINAELNSRGITDVTKEDAFMAWNKIASLPTDHAVVLCALSLDADDPLPHPILGDIVTRKAPVSATEGQTHSHKSQARPKSGPELEQYLRQAITRCVAMTLSADDTTIDPLLALAEMGMDSVMTVQLRSKLQQTLKIKAPPTLVWKCPTVNHLIKHFQAELSKD